MSSIKKLLAQMATEQVPQETEPTEEKSAKKGRALPSKGQQQQGKIPMAPRPKTQRKQSQKGG